MEELLNTKTVKRIIVLDKEISSLYVRKEEHFGYLFGGLKYKKKEGFYFIGKDIGHLMEYGTESNGYVKELPENLFYDGKEVYLKPRIIIHFIDKTIHVKYYDAYKEAYDKFTKIRQLVSEYHEI